jgi:RecA-family ATPase
MSIPITDISLVKDEPDKIIWTAEELLRADFPEPRWAVQGMIPVGLSNLAGRPKIGKSWLALQVAHAKAAGGQFLGQQVDQGRVLNLALEDSPRRWQDRLRTQQVGSTNDIVFMTEWPILSGDGLLRLESKIQEDNFALVIIDTLSRVTGRVDQSEACQTLSIYKNAFALRPL